MIESIAEWRLRTDYGQNHIVVRKENALRVNRRQKFPIRVEKNGVTVPVYRMLSGSGYTSFVISYRENGARRKKGFATLGEAVKEAKRAAGHIASGSYVIAYRENGAAKRLGFPSVGEARTAARKALTERRNMCRTLVP